jgi:hypothetical protein
MNLRKTLGLSGVAAAVALACAAAPASAQTRPAIVVRAEQCLRQNVGRVVAADHDMASAANFLVSYACAGEVEGARRYERNSAYVQMFSVMFKGMAQAQAVQSRIPAPPGAPAPSAKPPAPPPEFDATVDPETGQIVLPPSAPGTPANPLTAMFPMMESLFSQVAPDIVPVGLRKLAGELVLAASTKPR